MLYAFIGVILGTIIGVLLPIHIAPAYSGFTGALIVVLFDSLVGAIRAQIQGEYTVINFITGFLFYGIIALFFVYIGDKLNIDLYLGVVVVFLFRIVRNAGAIRHYSMARFTDTDTPTRSKGR